MQPPDYLDGAKVLMWAWSGQKPFGVVAAPENSTPDKVFGLAVCQYENNDGFYRFSCDRNWDVVQDGFYDSIKNAVLYLPEQYKDVEPTWLTK